VLACVNQAHAYPEFVSKGYISCKTCHVTAHGGSPLNAYGRGVGGELTTFGGPNLYAAGENYSLGASFRALQIRRFVPKAIIDDYFLMQKEISGYVEKNGISAGGRNSNWFVAVGSVGLALSYRHSLPTFGLNIENHTIKVRRMWKEVEYLEASISTSSVEAFVGVGSEFVSGKFVALFNWGRIGLSLHSDEHYAITAIVKVLEGLVVMAEANTSYTFGKVSMHIINGVWVYGQLDALAPGIGIRWLPVRHLTVEALMEKKRWWVLGHLYF